MNPEIRKLIECEDSYSGTPGTSLWRRVWPEGPLLFKPAILYTLILLLVVPYVYILKNDTPQIRGDVQMIVVSSIRTARIPQLRASLGTDGIVSFVYPEADPQKRYYMLIKDAEGKALFVDSSYGNFDTFGNGTIVIPGDLMTPGEYTIAVRSFENQLRDSGITYRFNIVE